jgi:diguanylate cyclase (GGDEF)-like protein
VLERLRSVSLISDPEERQFKARLARSTIRVCLVILTVWFILDIFLTSVILTDREYNFRFDYISIVAGFILTLLARWFVLRDQTRIAGYLLGGVFFFLSAIFTVFFPEELYLVAGGYLLSVLVSGAIAGGYSGFFFTALSLAMNVFGILRLSSLQADLPTDPLSSMVFLIIQVVTLLGLSVIMRLNSVHINLTVARLRGQTEQMSHLALTDPLTGLSNRRHLIQQLDREFTRAKRYQRPLSLVYLDLDGFKSMNDRFGHIFGDEILAGVALQMRSVLRSADMLARIGGDEFAVLLPETSLKGALRVAEKLRKSLAAYSSRLGPALPTLTFCAGVAQLNEDDQSIDDLLGRADNAQYRAKDNGKDSIEPQRMDEELPLFNLPKSDSNVA